MRKHLPDRTWSIPILLSALLVCVPGCSVPLRLPAVPKAALAQAEVVATPGVRYITGVPSTFSIMTQEGLESIKREQAYLAKSGHSGSLPPANFLAISGGGDDGAFGAGLLCGWTDSGQRPEFKLVTGISTGALIAPFAFLGAKYDATLRAVYTQSSPKDISTARGLLAAVFDDALADNKPLYQLTKKYVTQAMLQEIAAEYAKGRLLLIGTTNLDARRGVIWNMGKIAASGSPEALDLFHRIMVASAAIPGAFPPMMFDVEVGDKRYQEMHVDGGAIAQVFVYPPNLHLKQQAAAAGVQPRERNLYVIRNARLDPDWADVERRTLTIAQRAISSLIHTQGLGDLLRIYDLARRDGLDYHLAYIPETFDAPHKENFDPAYMRALFHSGYEMARKGYPWAKVPPGI